MTRKDDLAPQEAGRREPSLADLEAFERLLRDSLKAEAVPAQPAATPAQPPISAENALAEFNRMIEAPLSFDRPGQPASPSQITAIERALQSDPANPPVPLPPLPGDPLLDFEEELRRFEAMSRPAVPMPANPVEPPPELRTTLPAQAAPEWQTASAPAWQDDAPQGYEQVPAMNSGVQALEAADRRLSAEAEAAALAGGAALAAGSASGLRNRSRGVFYALGGVALAGLAIIGGMTLFGGRGKVASGDSVPVIAARPEPAKERPANPGGLEIPDQNKQVLAPRNVPTEQRPAQVVNQTEQPVDLNQQVNRRESVRIIAPSPFQSGEGNAPAAVPAPPANVPAPSATVSAASASPQPGEPRRVQSVRISDPVAPPAQPTPGGGVAAGGVAAGAVAGAIVASRQPAAPATPGLTPGAQAAIRPQAPVQPSAPVPQAPPAPVAAATPPKVEARPQSPVTAPRQVQTQPSQASQPPRAAQGAPLSLNPPRTANPPPAPRVANAAAGSGAFAIQLASRPSEADARAASGQLAQRYASQIGGRSTTVVRGEANGRTVYRIRALGFSQAEANAACDRIRAAGGGCFVTRQ